MPSDIATVIRTGSGGKRATSQKQALASAQKATRGIRVGRPSSYSPALCERAVALGMRGKTWAGIAAAFNISRETLYQWQGVYPDFADALSRARVAAQAFLEDHGRKNLKADRYQAQVWAKLISVHDDYKDQQRVDVTVSLEGIVSALAGPKVVEGASSFAPLPEPEKGKE